MHTKIFSVLFSVVSLASSVSAHVITERDTDLIKMQRNHFPQQGNGLIIKNSTNVKTLFKRQKSTSTPALARAESFYYIPVNLDKVKCRHSGQISYDMNKRPSVKDMSWELQPSALSLNGSLEKAKTHTEIQDTLNESSISKSATRAVPTFSKDDSIYIAVLADVAYKVYQNFVEDRVSGVVYPILNGQRVELRGKFLESGTLNKVLGNVFSYFFRENRKANGYRPVHPPIPFNIEAINE